MRWYVVNTRPRKEELARILLEQNGLEVFVPRVLEWSPSRRRTRERVTLLFPGYLFVRLSLNEHLARVRWTQGVRRLLGPDGHPAPVDDALVAELSARMGERGYLVQRPGLDAGDRVEVRGGPFAGLLGVVETPCTAAARVRVLLTIFARRTTVEVDARDLLRVRHGCS